jgi:hypothetical protein
MVAADPGEVASMRIDTSLEIVSDESLANVYESAGYGAAAAYLSRPNFVKRLFPPGVFGFFAFDDAGDLVGLVRIFSDDDLCSWIAEMCIRSDQHQDQVRGALLREMIERFGHTAIYTEAFEEEIAAYRVVGITAKTKLTALSRAPTLEPRAKPEPFMH